ncbi:MAG TPA: hypothetical protein VKE51_28640 [Vicinamibacterales bacterium]|nr:hypothetical protein [Vicinamibacterales bacterium]
MANDTLRGRPQSLEIFIDYLIEDEELRDAFLRSPAKTMRLAADWGVPLCDSEIRALVALAPAIWDRIADDVDARLQEAA